MRFADSALITSEQKKRWWTTLSSLILSFYIPASPVSPCELRSSFIALSACPERPRGAAEWPVAPLTLRAAVTLHHPALHLGWCGHLATRARVRRSWTRGYWEINRYASAQPSELPAWLAGWLPPPLPVPLLLTLLLPHLPCYGQMKTMQFSLFHTSLYVDILLQDKKCLCLPEACSSRGWCICPVNWPPFPPMFGLRGGETAINQISEEDFLPITVSAMKKCWPKITLVHYCSSSHPSTTFMNFFQHTGAFQCFCNNSTATILR